MAQYQPSAEELALIAFFTRQSGEQFRVHDGSFQLSHDFSQGWTVFSGDEAGFHEMLQQLSWEAEHRIEKKQIE